MTIARRLMILVAVPLLFMVALGAIVRSEMQRVETLSRFVVENQLGGITALGNISRSFATLRLEVRDRLLSRDAAEQQKYRTQFDTDKAEFTTLLSKYTDTRTSDAKD